MAAEAPEAIGAVEKTKQTRAAANAKRATAKERTAQESHKTTQQAHRTRQEELKTQRAYAPQKERATGADVNPPEKSGPNLPSIPRTTGDSGHRVIASAWVAGIAIISWQEIKVNKRPPDPRRFVGWSVTMGTLDLVSELISAQLGGVFAVGLVLGLLFFRQPTASTKPGTGDKTGSTPADSQTGTAVPSTPSTANGSAGNLSSTSPDIGQLLTGNTGGPGGVPFVSGGYQSD
jgi:hypothetical protein